MKKAFVTDHKLAMRFQFRFVATCSRNDFRKDTTSGGNKCRQLSPRQGEPICEATVTSLLTILVTAAPCTEVADRGMHPVLTAVVMLGWQISLFASGRLWSRGVAFRFFPQAYGLLVGLLWGLSEGSSAKVIELSLVNLGLGWMFWLCLFVSTFEGPYDLSSPSSRLPVPTRHRDEAAAAKRHRVQLAGVMQILLAPPLAAAPCPDARDRVGPPHR